MRFLFISILFSIVFSASAQTKKALPKKYPSLLWEITGKGLKKPSYLFGTMHVSSKMAFHLSDSFYLAIKNADVVALETNPESWQKDMSRYNFNDDFFGGGGSGKNASVPNDFLSIKTLQFNSYQKALQRALFSNPSIINNLLYRSNSDVESEFEENTFLDMYIFQVGKRWGKKVAGVEDFDESMKLVMEAYADSYKDKSSIKNIEVDEEFSYDKLQDAYRSGNLDLIDTINTVNTVSVAFNEKFLFKRNDNQAAAIDSIIKSKASLFVGVGAAHLPGNRGVIEILRRMGYKLRPINMLERDSKFKEEVEQLFVPAQLKKVTSVDGFYSASIPGEFYANENPLHDFDQQQFADMANGSYYMITRVPTSSSLWGYTNADVYRQVDSILYENIPGKIITKKNIEQNGYKGFDILNRTRRGDYQRYKIFITPLEVLIFKMSGNDEYVKNSTDASAFFNSIQIKENNSEWKKFTPKFGGFEVSMPGEPLVTNTENWQFSSYDIKTGNSYLVIKTDIHNYGFIVEDTFDLNLLDESFGSSEFIEKKLTQKQTKHNGYPALDAVYKHKNGSFSHVKYIIQGPHYYTLINHSKTKNIDDKFFTSFIINHFNYAKKSKIIDNELKFTAEAFVAEEVDADLKSSLRKMFADVMTVEPEYATKGTYKDKLFYNDTTGEKIYVSYYTSSKYYFDNDSTKLGVYKAEDEKWMVKDRKVNTLSNGNKVWEYKLTDKNSSRVILNKVFYTNGIGHAITVLTDTISTPSNFISGFFGSFKPVDSLSGIDPVTKKSAVFFSDFFSADTTLHKSATNNVDILEVDSTDFENIKKSIQSLTWKEKKYLDVKQSFIHLLGSIPNKAASDYLKNLYYASGDTLELQNVILTNLLKQKTQYSFNVFRDILLNEPPVLTVNSNYDYDEVHEDIFQYLSDSTTLTATIFKDILPLINLDDYELPIMNLMVELIDSNLLSSKDYEVYLPKFLIEAKQLWKKQSIAEKSKSIADAQKTEDVEKTETNKFEDDYGNDMLSMYARLLMPFWKTNPSIPTLMNQLLSSTDKRLKYNTTILMLENNVQLPDSLVKYFASLKDYRYELYSDLKTLNKLSLFPAVYHNQKDLALSKLLYTLSVKKPDTISFLKMLPLNIEERSGNVFFFKYKDNKEDNAWKIASVGLIPSNNKEVEFSSKYEKAIDFTLFTETKLDEEIDINEQLQKVLKKLIYSKRKSAQNFYLESFDTQYDYVD